VVSSSSIFFFFSSPNLSRRRLDVCHISTQCGPTVNLRCRSETCCKWLAGNTGCKSRQKSPSGHHRRTLSGYIFAIKAHIDIWEKNLLSTKQQYLLHMPHNMVNIGSLAAEIGPLVWGTRANFNRFRVCSITARCSSIVRQPNFAALNRGRHLHLAERPSRWASAHILVLYNIRIINLLVFNVRVFAVSS